MGAIHLDEFPKISSPQMEQKIPGNSDISEKMVNFERLPKFFERIDPKITVPFDSAPKIPNWRPVFSQTLLKPTYFYITPSYDA